MELIVNLGSQKDKNGNYYSIALFLCPYCLQEVIKRLSPGKIAKSCGCMKKEFTSILHKGKIVSKETRKKQSEAKKGKYTGEHNPNYGNGDKIRGENNPMFGKKGKEHPKFGFKHTEEFRQNQSKRMTGENNPMFGIHNSRELSPNWNGGSSFLSYPPEFNKPLKQSILERDNYTCQCPDCEHLSERLEIHHIDFDKKNNNPENLITLCNKCHNKTKGINNREYWINHYQKSIKQKYAY